MKQFIKTAIILLILSLCAVPSANAEGKGGASGQINVDLTGFRSSSGEVRVHLYRSSEGFPSSPGKAMATIVNKIEGSVAHVVFKEIPFGEYAISVLHDENGNKKLDMNWLMMPKEGIGASNNPKSTFGPPGFNDAKFRLDKDEMTIGITVRY